MKLSIGDVIRVKASGLLLKATVEDASKGDEIQAKVEAVESEGESRKYEVGKVYFFSRDAIQPEE